MYSRCPSHADFARQGCPACLEARTRPPSKSWLLTGIERYDLERVRDHAIRSEWTDTPPALTFEELLDRFIEDCRGEAS